MPQNTYELFKMLASRGKLTAVMLNLSYDAGHITEEQYRELCGQVTPPAPTPRRWSRMTIKGALAEATMLDAVEAYLSTVNIRPNYSAWQALNDCDYIEEGYPDAESWGAVLDGAAQALGKTRADVDAFLNALPTE